MCEDKATFFLGRRVKLSSIGECENSSLLIQGAADGKLTNRETRKKNGKTNDDTQDMVSSVTHLLLLLLMMMMMTTKQTVTEASTNTTELLSRVQSLPLSKHRH